jgi:hypothetical protein
MAKTMRFIEDVSTGNSSKRWVANWHNGEIVETTRGTRTIFRCGTREAEHIEVRYRIYLTELEG